MKFNNCPLKNELKEGLLQYERDTNIPPHSLIESLIEKFLYKKGYLVVGAGSENVPFPCELNKPPLHHATLNRNGKYIIRHTINGTRYHYGYCTYEEAIVIIDFLEEKNWDVRYSTKYSDYKGRKHIDFLFNEIEKESNLMETE